MEKGMKTVFCIVTVMFLVFATVGCGVTTPMRTANSRIERERNADRNTKVTRNVRSKGEEGALQENIETSAGEGGSSKDVPAHKAAFYRIGPGDVLHISVWNNKEMNQDVMVRPDGKISLPLLQDVNAEGFTAEELRKVIELRLKEFLIEPVVTVVVKQVNYPKFFIMGEVARPGTYPLREKLTLLQAISIAGGFTQFASPSRIVLIRHRGDYQEKMTFNYYDILKSNPSEANPVLKPGDTIVVP